MKFLINGMDFNVFNSLPKEDAEFLAQLESYDKYPLWDYEEFNFESVEFDELFDTMIGTEENGATMLVKDTGSLIKNTGKLGWSTLKTGAAVGAGAIKGVNYGIKGINTGIRWIQAAVKWVCGFIQKSYKSTREWLKGSMGPMLNNLWQSFAKFSERWDQLDSDSRQAIGILNTMGVLQNATTFGYHRGFDIQALAAFYHIVENVESYINAYIWTYFNFKYTGLNDLIGKDAQGDVINGAANNNPGAPNDNANEYAPAQNESIQINDFNKYFDFAMEDDNDNTPDNESQLNGVCSREAFGGESMWIRPSEIAAFSKAMGEYFKNGQNGQGIDKNQLVAFKQKLDRFAKCAKTSSEFGDLTFAYCIFGSRESQNYMNIPENEKQGWFSKWFSNRKQLKSVAKGKHFEMKTPDVADKKVDFRALPNMGINGAGAYIKTAICGFNDGGVAFVEQFRQGNEDIQRFKDICQKWLAQVTNVTGACRNMTKLLKGNARPITRFTTLLLDGLPDIVRDLNDMASQLNGGSLHTGNQNTTGMAQNPNQPNTNGSVGSNFSGSGRMDGQAQAIANSVGNWSNGSASVIDEIFGDIATEDPGTTVKWGDQRLNNPNYANQDGINKQNAQQQNVANQQQIEQAQKLKELQVLFKDIASGVTAYQTTIQGVCSSYATYVRGFMGAVFEYIIDTESIIKAIYSAAGNNVNQQMAEVQQQDTPVNQQGDTTNGN